MDYAPIYPHGEVQEIGNDIFVVLGSIKFNALVRFSRNMVIVRNGESLTVIDPIRLTDKVEAQLTGLGKVENVLRLGAFHGLDDPYYVNKFNAKMWSQPGGTTYTQPAIDVELNESAELPFSNARLIEFNGTAQPECAICIDDGDGILLTCDAIQHYADYDYCNFVAKLMLPRIGFPKTTLVGPIWLKMMTPEGGSLELELRRLLDLKFDRLISAHGSYLPSGAHAAVTRAINNAFV